MSYLCLSIWNTQYTSATRLPQPTGRARFWHVLRAEAYPQKERYCSISSRNSFGRNIHLQIRYHKWWYGNSETKKPFHPLQREVKKDLQRYRLLSFFTLSGRTNRCRYFPAEMSNIKGEVLPPYLPSQGEGKKTKRDIGSFPRLFSLFTLKGHTHRCRCFQEEMSNVEGEVLPPYLPS